MLTRVFWSDNYLCCPQYFLDSDEEKGDEVNLGPLHAIMSCLTDREMDVVPCTSQSPVAGSSHATEETPQIDYAAQGGSLRGRKMTKCEENWLKTKRKRCRNSGETYTTAKNKFVPAKTFTSNFDCKCSRECPEKSKSQDVLQTSFPSFLTLGNYSQQNVFLRRLVQTSKCARSCPQDGIGYCTLQISWGPLYRHLSKDEVVFGVLDGRGKNISANKIDDEDVVAHI
ncbi:hypothetical protein PR048_031154 [Dryococelus australis]|uniref:Uncharacterized protein n=1 Tax=Dryococelus australis TaxID=614101 RepID=A0ABQ9G4G2_9NEOP|nr:hypothetical protein PR048_031154 [Dryococelus australis]